MSDVVFHSIYFLRIGVVFSCYIFRESSVSDAEIVIDVDTNLTISIYTSKGAKARSMVCTLYDL